MATIRFIREGLEVQCNPGENLRELVMKENLQLYGLKGILGNCGGAGQCSTCFISVEGGNQNSLSPLTSVEEEKLKNRPENWVNRFATLHLQGIFDKKLLLFWSQFSK